MLCFPLTVLNLKEEFGVKWTWGLLKHDNENEFLSRTHLFVTQNLNALFLFIYKCIIKNVILLFKGGNHPT